jgi:hypothetical protein
MDVAYVSAMAALVGSVVGGLTAGGTTRLSQRAHVRARQLAHEAGLRESLYREFIIAASRAYSHALLNSEPQIARLVSLYAMTSRMRIVSSPRTIECADKTMLTIVDTYFSPNRSVRELRDLARVGSAIDPLRDFSEVAREEMRLFMFR